MKLCARVFNYGLRPEHGRVARKYPPTHPLSQTSWVAAGPNVRAHHRAINAENITRWQWPCPALVARGVGSPARNGRARTQRTFHLLENKNKENAVFRTRTTHLMPQKRRDLATSERRPRTSERTFTHTPTLSRGGPSHRPGLQKCTRTRSPAHIEKLPQL